MFHYSVKSIRAFFAISLNINLISQGRHQKIKLPQEYVLSLENLKYLSLSLTKGNQNQKELPLRI